MTRPPWLGRAVRNRHHHAIEQVSRRWNTPSNFDFHTGADADVAASMEMALATFLRLAARRLKTSRAVLAGQCKASGHRRSLERWGPVLTDAKKRLADALDLKAPPPSVTEKKGWFRRRSRDWRCAVSALKSQTAGGRWRLRAEIEVPATSRDVRVDCRASDM